MIQQSAKIGGYLNLYDTFSHLEEDDSDHSSTNNDLAKAETPTTPSPAPDAESYDEEAVARSVDFARLVSLSSLGTQEALNDRLTGRREIDTQEARLRRAAGDSFIERPSTRHEAFELRVADVLETRGYTFEAELRYQRLPDNPVAAVRLAQLLEVKGYTQEAWEAYLKAARRYNIEALFRLAAIAYWRGEKSWATALVAIAHTRLDREALGRIATKLLTLTRSSRKGHEHRTAEPAVHLPARGDPCRSYEPLLVTSYAVATELLVTAHRPDLARLAYCSALASGHTLAALSLLDAVPRTESLIGQRSLRMLLDWGLAELVDEARTSEHAEIRKALESLKEAPQPEQFEELVSISRRDRDPRQRSAALNRVINTSYVAATLIGLCTLDCSPRSQELLKKVGEEQGRKLRYDLHQMTHMSGSELMLRFLERTEAAVCRVRHQNRPVLESCQPQGSSGNALDVPMSGAVHRLHRELRLFSPDQRNVTVLRVAGLQPADVAATLELTEERVEEVWQLSVSQLQAGQSGEQFHPDSNELLWAEVEDCFSVTEEQNAPD